MPNIASGGTQQVSVLGLGCGSYGSSISEAAAYGLLDAFVDSGGTLLDTAHIYGAWDTRGVNGGYSNSEVVIGHWLRARGCRRQIVLGTKGGHPDFDSGERCMTQAALMRQLHERCRSSLPARLHEAWQNPMTASQAARTASRAAWMTRRGHTTSVHNCCCARNCWSRRAHSHMTYPA